MTSLPTTLAPPTTAVQRAVFCGRVSSDKQEKDGTSLDTQLASGRAYAADPQRRYDMVAEFQETFTGTLLWERPKLMALTRLVEAGQVDVLVVHALDRLSRNQAHRSFLFVHCARHGVRIESVTEQLDDSIQGKIVRLVSELYAEYELVIKKERTERGKRARAGSGRPISASLPYGYRWEDPEPHKKTRMAVYEPEALIVRRIFDWLAGGGTATALMYALNAEGIPSPKPKEGQLNKWSTKTIGRIVRNDAYIGKAWAYKSQSLYENGKRVRLPNRPESERVALPDGTIPPSVDAETFRKAEERLVHNRREATRNHHHAELFLLRGGFAKCHHCGGTLEAMTAPRGDRYYRCIPAQRRKHGCPSCSIRVEALESAVWDRVTLVLGDRDFIGQQMRQQAESDQSANNVASLDAALVELSQQEGNLARALAMIADPGAAGPLVAQLDAIAGNKRTLQRDRQSMLDLRAAHDRTSAMLDRLPDVFAERWAQIENMTMAERRDVLVDFGVVATVYPKDAPDRWHIDMAFDLSAWFDAATGYLRADEGDAPDCSEAVAVGHGGIAERQSGAGH